MHPILHLLESLFISAGNTHPSFSVQMLTRTEFSGGSLFAAETVQANGAAVFDAVPAGSFTVQVFFPNPKPSNFLISTFKPPGELSMWTLKASNLLASWS